MRLYFCLFLFGLFIWNSAWADDIPCGTAKDARYEILGDFNYDFGDVDIQNDSIFTVFYVKSVGDAPMLILNGSTTCPCTQVACTQDIVQPGDTVGIIVTYHPIHSGPFKQSATVSTNTKPYSYFRVLIKGNVVEAVSKD